MNEENEKEHFKVSYYFLDALKHYVEHQTHYHQMLPERLRPESLSVIPLSLMKHIIEHLSEETVSFEAVFHHAINNAKSRVKMVAMTGIYDCGTCQAKALIPIEVKTSRDHLEYVKNGQVDFKVLAEYEKTEETISLNLMIPESFAPGCNCLEKTTDINSLVNRNTHIGIHLSDKDIEDLNYLVDKENEKTNQRVRTEG